jgi:hypothetical protein
VGRPSAIFLLLVFSAELIQPLLSLPFHSSESQLPACCRRDGKHGCSMLRARTSKPTVRGVCAEYQVRKGSPVLLESSLAATPSVSASPLDHRRESAIVLPSQPAPGVPQIHAGRGPPLA